MTPKPFVAFAALVLLICSDVWAVCPQPKNRTAGLRQARCGCARRRRDLSAGDFYDGQGRVPAGDPTI